MQLTRVNVHLEVFLRVLCLWSFPDDSPVTADGSDSYQAVKDAGRFRFVLHAVDKSTICNGPKHKPDLLSIVAFVCHILCGP